MKNRNFINTKRYHFPCGEMILGSFDGKLCLCDWVDGKRRLMTDFRLQRIMKALYVDETSDIIEMARRQLNEYFDCRRMEFDIPLFFVGTDFQKKVWCELLKIPYGTTLSYGEIARRIDAPKAVRAVANANGANAISIIAPCHRVIGNDGKLVGYGGGLEKKQYLLELEQRQ